MQKRVIFLVFDGFELLDRAGPTAVFRHANYLFAQSDYAFITASAIGGIVHTLCGLAVQTTALQALRFRASDTVLAMGGLEQGLQQAARQSALVDGLRRAASSAGRFGSICSGTFLLAAAGLLNGRRATTHWRACALLQKSVPSLHVMTDDLYVVDDRLWTSGGATAGIDMALSMLEADHGSYCMTQVAQHLLVYARRPGHQSQFSPVLQAQASSNGDFSELIHWLTKRLHTSIRVSEMATRAAMSERNFSRRFTAQLKIAPAKFFENLRLDHSKALLCQGIAVKAVFPGVGFRSESAFRSAFVARFGMTPGNFQGLHSTSFKSRELVKAS